LARARNPFSAREKAEAGLLLKETAAGRAVARQTTVSQQRRARRGVRCRQEIHQPTEIGPEKGRGAAPDKQDQQRGQPSVRCA